MKKYKALIAGTGNPHIPGYIARSAQPESRIYIAAIADYDQGRLERSRKQCADPDHTRFYTDYRQMFAENPDADIVIIGSDNIDHLKIFKDAMEYHYHIYMMKVISMDEAECREMMRLEKTYDKKIGVELELHFNSQFVKARELYRSGAIGELISVYLTNVSQSPCNYYPNWGSPELSYGKRVPLRPGYEVCRGGAITDHPHPYDVVRWITGHEFKTVRAFSSRNQRSHLMVEDHAAITGKLDNGVPYFINPSYSNLEENCQERRLLWPKSLECNLKLTGTRGYISADFFDRHTLEVGNHVPSPDRLIVNGVPGLPIDPDDSLMGSFVAAIEGRRGRAETGLRESYEAVRVMNAAYDSIEQNREITLEKTDV